MLKTIIRSKNEEELRDLQQAVHLATESAIGFGQAGGVLVNPLIKKDEDESFFSVSVGPIGDNVIIDASMEDNLNISYGAEDEEMVDAE